MRITQLSQPHRTPQPSHSLATLTSHNIPRNIAAMLATNPLKAIPYWDPQPPNRLGSISHINIYDSPRAIHSTPRAPPPTNSNTPAHPHKHSTKQIDATRKQTRAHRLQGSLPRHPCHQPATTCASTRHNQRGLSLHLVTTRTHPAQIVFIVTPNSAAT